MIYSKVSTVLYVIWGVLHIAAAYSVFALGQSLDEGMVQARLFQNAFYLLAFAIAGVYIAVRYNWHNSALGYWLNLVMISAADIPFILFILIPGYIPIVPGVLGPLLWILALTFSTVAYRVDARAH